MTVPLFDSRSAMATYGLRTVVIAMVMVIVVMSLAGCLIVVLTVVGLSVLFLPPGVDHG